MPETKLKPCPFCGSTKVSIDCKLKYAGYRKGRLTCFVSCKSCHARGSTAAKSGYDFEVDRTELEKKAAENWNKRCVSVDCFSAEKIGEYCCGYQKGENNDEPIDRCEKCSKHEFVE